MASSNFETEKSQFREFYESNYRLLEDAKNSFITLLNALVTHAGNISISKVEGRVKNKEECIKKFNLKYRTELEKNETPYAIKDHISDIIGLRIVCLYEDDIERIKTTLNEHFEVLDISDKISQIENTEGSFGYKGLHLDLKLKQTRRELPEYLAYADFSFEVQIRTIVQDSWSVLDHKIKYKKSIPNSLKRRINTLAALFELADREFKEIRLLTEAEIKTVEEEEYEEEAIDATIIDVTQDATPNPTEPTSVFFNRGLAKLNAFNFLKIAKHFFNDFEFEPYKVDGFTGEIVTLDPSINRGTFNFYMRENIAKVKRYQSYFERKTPQDKLNPFTLIRHCLYLGNKDTFGNLLTNISRESFEQWLAKNP